MPQIRTERRDDVAAIHAVLARSFPTEDEARLVDQLRESGRLQLSLVAEVDGAVVGHIAFSLVFVDGGGVGAGLGPVAVAGPHRRQGVAAKLVQAGLDACKGAGVGWAVVLGDPSYYARFGFRTASEWGLSDEYHGGSAFQAIELIPGTLPRGAGRVRYGPEFAVLS